MDLELLKAAIEAEEQSALGYLNGNLAASRTASLKAYQSEPYGNEVDGRSQVVTSDVSDVVEGVIPSLMRVFTSGDDICQFEAVGPEDEAGAKQETEVTNYYLTQANNFVPFLQTWLRDGLISKNGYTKVIWEDDELYEQESYTGLDENELPYLMQVPGLEVVEQDQDEMGLYSVKLKKMVMRGRPKLYNCPPESVLVNSDHTEVSLRTAKFVQHRVKMSISDLRKMGYKIDDDIADGNEGDWHEENITRNRYEDEWDQSETSDPAGRVVTFKETYYRYDADGDGVTELRKVCHIGSTILANDEVDSIPIACWTPNIMPHRHIGRSLAEMVEDIQQTKTSILRAGLDSLYLSIHGRYAISDRVNLDDMLVSRPGGVVRLTDGAMPGEGHIMPLVPPALAGQAFPALEYMDSVRESRTGITRYNQGMDANSLNKTATGIQMIASAAQGRMELIARTFAETGLRDLMLELHSLIRKHSDKETAIKLRNTWVPVDPRGWKTRYDMTINVGLGTGNREQQMANLMGVMNIQKEAFQSGIVTPENIYNAASKMAEIAGFKAPEMFFTNTKGKGPQIPPQIKMQIQKGMDTIKKQQAEIQQLTAKLQAKDADKSAEIYKVDKQSATEIQKVQMQNESKAMLLNMQTIYESIRQSQDDLSARFENIEGKDTDLTTIIEAIEELNAKIDNSTPVGIRQIRDETGMLIGGVRIMPDGSEQEISIQ